jgi:ubiquinol-cytochrome c reductase cytochrome b subunit
VGSPFRWLDERVDLVGVRRALLDRKMPGGLTWWHTLGSATLVVFMVQVVTGVILAMYYSPSPDHAYDSIRFLQDKVISGSTLRGIHHWGASAMVVLALAHMCRVFVMGAYKYPREINWLLGVVLLFIVLGFGFTGYLLPWDQKAYWATQVGTNIAGTTPVIGGQLVRLLRGGSQLGAATLARFFALHVLLLPLLLGGVVFLHLAIVIRQGIAPRSRALDTDAPPRTDDPGYPSFYRTAYERSKGAGVPFWPNITTKDVVVGAVVVLTLLQLARSFGAGLEPPADPTDTSYVPRPEWYFLPFFQLLKLVPGSMESTVAVGLPAVLVLTLLLLPFFDRGSTRSFARRPVARMALILTVGICAMLIGGSLGESDGTEEAAIATTIGRPLTSVERAGRALYQAQGCSSCHAIAGKGGGSKEDAPPLTDVGLKHSGAWLHSFMENPMRFHPDTKMPSFGPPTLTHQEIEELTRFLTTLRGPGGEFKKPEFRDTFPELPKPKE